MDKNRDIRNALRKKAFAVCLFHLLNGLVLTAVLILVLIGLGVGLSMAVSGSGALFAGYGFFSWAMIILALGGLLLVSRPVSAEKIAALMESRYPELNSELISALQLGGNKRYLTESLGISGNLIDALGRKIQMNLPAIRQKSLVNRRLLGQNLFILAVMVMASAGGARFHGEEYSRVISILANPVRAYRFAGPVLEVSPGDIRLPEGDGLVITAATSIIDNDPLYLETGTAGPGGDIDSMRMKFEAPGVFSIELRNIVESMQYRVVHSRAASAWYSIDVAIIPRAGDLALTFTYPAYTGLQPRRQEGTGHISCLKGTMVKWEARANKQLSEASLITGSGEVYPLELGEGDIIEGEFIVTAGGRYRVSLKDTEGLSPLRPDEYDISLLPDEYPVVDLLVPEGDLELDTAALVDIYFSARDDFGLKESALKCSFDDGRTVRIRLPDPLGRKNFQSGYSWDLGSLGLQPGQRVEYHVEVLDNDSISGPKAGFSSARSIFIKDAGAVHRDLAELEKELAEEFTDLLGDELELMSSMEEFEGMREAAEDEFQSGLNGLQSSQDKTTRKFEQTLEKMDEFLKKASGDVFSDPSSLYMKVLARQMLEKVLEGEKDEGRQLEELSAMEDMPREDRTDEMKWMAEKKEKRISSMEQAINLMQESSRYQKMKEVVRDQERMMDRQRDLMDRLDELKGGLTEASARELAGMLKEIAGMLSDLINQLTTMQEELPEEFINADAMEELPLDDIMKSLEELARAISEGDMEKAAKIAEELLKQMNSLMDKLKEATGQLESLTSEAADDFQKNRISELGRIVEEQKALLKRTETLSRSLERSLAKIREESARRLRDILTKTADIIRERLSSLKVEDSRGDLAPVLEPLMPMLNRDLNSLRSGITQFNARIIEQSLDSLESKAVNLMEVLEQAEVPEKEASSAGGKVEDILKAAREAARVASEGSPDEAGVATPGEIMLLDEMAGEQKALEERTVVLAEKIDTLAKILPMISADLGDNLREAAEFMDKASGELSLHLPSRAAPLEREALYRLMEAQNSALQASGQMSRMAGLKKGGGRAEQEAQQLFGMMPGLAASPATGTMEGGRMGLSIRNFKIPGSQEFEVPRIFREEIMKSMKEGYPKVYEKAIRQYYRSIAE